MRPIWGGTISFGLVTIPVKLYSATQKKRPSFRLLAKEDQRPVKYKRWSPTLDKEIPYEGITKGLEVSKGRFIPFTDEELRELRPEKTQRIDVQEFVPAQDIDALTVNSQYFLAPDREKDKAYFLFARALTDEGKAAVGTFILRDKQYVCAILPYGDGLLLTTLHFADEIRDPKRIPSLAERPEISEQELGLAKDLIAHLSKESLRLEEYHDTFTEQLEGMLAEKREGIAPVEEAPRITEEEDLLSALRQSIAEQAA